MRVRRDADEQLVLAHVFNRLSNNVVQLTVQIFKDDWSRPSSVHILNNLGGSFGSTSPTGSAGVSRAPSPPSGNLYTASNPYKSVQRSGSPFGGIGLPPVLIPSRTDPAVVLNGPTSPNIPALRLAANAPGNSNMNWNRASLPMNDISYERTHSGVASDTSRPPSQVVSLDNIGSSYLGSGLNLGMSPPPSARPSTIPYTEQYHHPPQPAQQQTENYTQVQKYHIGKQT